MAPKYILQAGHKASNYANEILNYLPSRLSSILTEGTSAAFGPIIDSLPLHLAIEPTNICNLKCPLCTTSQVMKRKKGVMKYEHFKSIIDDIVGFVRRINMSFAGEPLLCPDVFKMVSYAESRNIKVYFDTNGTIDRTGEIVDSGLSSIDISLDGTSKKSYEKYRIGANFEKVVENIKKLCDAKKARNLNKPQIVLQFIVFKHNQHELPAIIELSKTLGVDSLILKAAALNSQALGLNQQELAQKYLPGKNEYTRFYAKNGIASIKVKRLCEWAFSSLILYNGDVTICCYDHDGKYTVGNVFKEGGFKKIWKGQKYRAVRRALFKRRLPLCKICSFAGDTIIMKKEI